ncbi:MAG: glycoside hydrolase family 11 protein [Oscillospiraceae bacterium]|nr:glycoside hydrolase family 11 protein [Oscillospiraceae bacterium]
MHRKHRITALAAALMMGVSMLPLTAHAETVTGERDGYYFERQTPEYGTSEMEALEHGRFNCTWDVRDYCFFFGGWKTETQRPVSSFGNIAISFEFTDADENSGYFCGAYGFLADPDVEYYIVEDWGVWKPPGTYEREGMANIDGASYELYKIEKQSEDIAGISKKITQYMSIRCPGSERKGGTISVGKHFKAWEKQGWKVGDLYSVGLFVDAHNSAGSMSVKKNNIYLGNIDPPEPTTPTHTTVLTEPGDVNGDGEQSVSDIILLQKYLLGLDAEIDLAAADLNGDGVVDIFDLGLLKRRLLRKRSEN